MGMRPHRRSAMRVRDGRVLKKNNWRLDPGDYRALAQDEIRLDRRRPPEGCRHLITIGQLRSFIALLPDWDEVAIGLDAIVLDSATDCDGWCGPGVVAVCAWQQELWDWWRPAEIQSNPPGVRDPCVRVPAPLRHGTPNGLARDLEKARRQSHDLSPIDQHDVPEAGCVVE